MIALLIPKVKSGQLATGPGAQKSPTDNSASRERLSEGSSAVNGIVAVLRSIWGVGFHRRFMTNEASVYLLT